jgi:GTP-binding protein
VAAKPKLVVATKLDALDDEERLNELKQFSDHEGLEFYAISAASGLGLKELLYAVERRLDGLRRAEEEKVEAVVNA